MQDDAKCDGEGCPRASKCWRFVKPAVGHQDWLLSEWDGTGCGNYIPTSKRKDRWGEREADGEDIHN